MNSFNDPFVVDPLSFSQIQWEQLNQSLFASTPAADSSSLSSLSSPASLHMDPHQQHPTQPQHASFDPLSSPYISYPPLPSSTQLLNPSEQSSYDLPSLLSEQGIRATAEGIFLPANHELGAFMSWEQVRLLFQSEEVVRRVGTLMVNQGHNQSPGAQSPLEQGSPYAGSTGYQDLSPLSSMAGTSSVPPSGPTQSSFLTPWRSSSTADQRARSCSPSHLSPGAGSASLMGLVGGLGGPSPGMGGNDSMFNHHSSSSSTISSTAPAPLSSKPLSAGPAGLSKKKKPSLLVVPPPKAPPHLDVLPSTEPLIFYWDTSNGAPVAGSSASELMTAGGLREGLMEIRLSAGSYWRVFEKGSGEEVWPFTGKGPGNEWIRGQALGIKKCSCGFSFLGTLSQDVFKRPSVVREHLATCNSRHREHPLRLLATLQREGDKAKPAIKTTKRKRKSTDGDADEEDRAPQPPQASSSGSRGLTKPTPRLSIVTSPSTSNHVSARAGNGSTSPFSLSPVSAGLPIHSPIAGGNGYANPHHPVHERMSSYPDTGGIGAMGGMLGGGGLGMNPDEALRILLQSAQRGGDGGEGTMGNWPF